MPLSIEQQILIEQRITNDGKSIVVAYLFWFFLAPFGAHRFYLGKTISGFFMPILGLIGLFFSVIFPPLGFLLLFVLIIWVIVDAFLIPSMVKEQQNKMRDTLTKQALNN